MTTKSIAHLDDRIDDLIEALYIVEDARGPAAAHAALDRLLAGGATTTKTTLKAAAPKPAPKAPVKPPTKPARRYVPTKPAAKPAWPTNAKSARARSAAVDDVIKRSGL